MNVESRLAEAGAAGIARFPARPRSAILTAIVWVVGSAIVVLAQPDSDRQLAALGAAVASIGVILAVTWLTARPEQRYVRSVIGAVVAVSLTSGWILHQLGAVARTFSAPGFVERIALPLLVVLIAPLIVSTLPRELVTPRAAWARRAALQRAARPMDWIMLAYATVVLAPALAVGLSHHDRGLYIAQDLGLIAFFVFMYIAGRAVRAEAGRMSAETIIGVLLAVAAGRYVLYHWEPAPLYSYMEAACAGALAYTLLRPRQARVLPSVIAATLLALDAVTTIDSASSGIASASSSTIAIELVGAVALLCYLAARFLRLVPSWLVIAAAAVALIGFVGFTPDGAALRGQYHGADLSNVGRSYEAQQVRASVRDSPLSLAFGRGLGATINERHAPPGFTHGLVEGGRDLAHVQEIHLLVYSFLLKTGALGLAWLLAFAVGLVALTLRAIERAARTRDPSFVIYAALPFLGFFQALAATSRLQADPLNALALGILVTGLGASRLGSKPEAVERSPRIRWRRRV